MSRLVIGTAGHIDHGKSALVRALTGIEPDRLKEERERGITIDLGFAHTQVGDVTLAFVDVPGHERFIRNMLAGATGIDAALLVVAADESVMPQTREHLDICRLLDVRTGIIALTKADLADADLRQVAREETRALVRGTFLEAAPIIEVSSMTGEGLDALRDALRGLASAATARSVDGATRLPIDRAFTLRGFGAVVTGTLASGVVSARDSLMVLPRGLTTRVRGLHVHGCAVETAQAGERVALNLGDVSVQDLARGDTLVRAGAFEPTRVIDVRIELLADAPALRHGARVRFHQATSEVMARVALARVLDDAPATSSEAARPVASSAPAGGRAWARLRLEAPVVVARGDRFVLRSYSPMMTIGGGLVLDPLPRRGRPRTPASLARFAQLDPRAGESPSEATIRALHALVAEEGAAGASIPGLVVRLGVPGAALESMGAAEASAGRLVRAADRLIAPADWESARQSLVAMVRGHHDAAPTVDGLPREEARDRLRLEPRVFEALLESVIDAELLTGRERLTLPGRDAGALAADQAALAAAEAVLARHGLAPPEPADLAAEASLTLPAMERALARLAREKRIVRVGGVWMHRTTIDGLIADVRAMKGAGGDARVDVAAFKARYGLSRKFAIPLLEFLDRERVTKRVGDVRVVL
jgi:selenocysteine-specific elongation factor